MGDGVSVDAVLEGLVAELAAIEHERWSHWQKHMHDQGSLGADGSLTLPPELVARWQRQMSLPYGELSPSERESDRQQVLRYLPLISDTLKGALALPETRPRSFDDYSHERQALDAAHNQNEANRDAFIALAHTALFAASVSFVGDVTPLNIAIWKPILITGWLADVLGLLALTLSFVTARREIDARREALNDDNPPAAKSTEILNSAALWSFPLALIAIFSFVTVNVVHANGKASFPAAAQSASPDTKGSDAAATRAEPPKPLDRGHTSPPSPGSGPKPSASAIQEVTTKPR